MSLMRHQESHTGESHQVRVRQKGPAHQNPEGRTDTLTTPRDKEPQGTTSLDVGSILLAEDNDMVRSLVGSMLEALGYQVISAQDGREALNIFQDKKDEIGLVLSDVAMPRMDGWKMIAAIREIEPGIPVILASGYTDTLKQAGQYPEQPQAILYKPFKMAALQETIEWVLEESKG